MWRNIRNEHSLNQFKVKTMKDYKYGLLFLALAFLGYHSVYFEKLSEVRAQEEAEFDFQAFADSLYYEGMLKNDQAVELSKLLEAIQTDAEEAFEQYGNRLGIGNSAYFMVRCSGEISGITVDAIRLATKDAGSISINTRYIFGNALRDASGLVKLTDFKTNAEFNRVSEALNALIRTKVIPPIVEQLQIGDEIEITGAIKLSKKKLDDPALMITPAQIMPQ
jgi:predicted lipoprotein